MKTLDTTKGRVTISVTEKRATIKVFLDGDEIKYSDGDELIDAGTYKVIVSDEYGNANAYTFTIEQGSNVGLWVLIALAVLLTGGGSFGCRGKIRYNRLIEAEGWVHVVGEVKPFAVITEGPLKADVIHTLTGLTVISVPGVNTLSHLKATLEEMKSRGLCEIKTAFDMDMMTNHNVRNGFLNLMELLDGMDFKFGTYVWDARYKGLDDYVWES